MIDDARNRSVIGRLLEELSWVGSTIRDYRQGGRGYENVLTAEVLLALDFLPRRAFFGRVIEGAVGATEARQSFLATIEEAAFTLLPGNHELSKTVSVQPDGIIESPSSFALVEAKRIKSSAFQSEQLAREYLLLLRDSARKTVPPKTPLFLLILGQPPPVRVKGNGRMEIKQALSRDLRAVHKKSDALGFGIERAEELVDKVVCWTTWDRIAQAIRAAQLEFKVDDASLKGTVDRLAASALAAIEWHSK